MKKINSAWKRFFTWCSSIAMVLTLASVIATYYFYQSMPKDCEACWLGAVVLVPIWLLNFLAIIVLAIGLWVWFFKKTDKAYARVGLVVIAIAILVYFVASLVLAY